MGWGGADDDKRLPRLAEVLTVTEEAGQARLQAVEALAAPAHPKPYNG